MTEKNKVICIDDMDTNLGAATGEKKWRHLRVSKAVVQPVYVL